jgi:uncharacterized protein YdeI (YjbR/CyaY-like superfamily)
VSADEREPGQVEPLSRAEWREWLAANCDVVHGVWLVLHKGSGPPLTYEEAVLEAVAAGWIDSRTNRLDESRYKLWMSPRKPRSGWSRSNKVRVEHLTTDGLMTPRGIAAVEVAKANGSWEKLDAAVRGRRAHHSRRLDR